MRELKKNYPEPDIVREAEGEEAVELEMAMLEFLDRLHEMHRIIMFKLFDLTAAGIQEKEVVGEDDKYFRRLKDEIGRHCRLVLLRVFEDLKKVDLLGGNTKAEYGVALASGLVISEDRGKPLDCDLEDIIRRNYLGKTRSLLKDQMMFAEYVWGGKADPITVESEGVTEVKSVLSPRAQYFATGAREILEEQVEEYLARLEADRVIEQGRLNGMVRLAGA